MRLLRTTTFAGVIALAGCGYFNAMYNAERRFADAERASAEGQRSVARDAYREAIDKAAASYRSHPDGRWADDALYLIGRSHFMMGEYERASAALGRVVEQSADRRVRGGAFAYLGASELALGRPAAALAPLDSAVAMTGNGQLAAFVRLSRARALFAAGRDEEARADLDRAQQAGGAIAAEARLEAATRALVAGDSIRVRTTLLDILGDRGAARWADSVGTLAGVAAHRWGAGFALDALPIEEAAWPNAAADALLLRRARLAHEVGQSDAAIRDAEQVGRRAGRGLADSALTLAARWRLTRAASLEELAHARALLLPALGHTPARDLLHAVRTVEVLVGYARERGRPLALFAAAEHARDRLRAPGLAGELFLAYADLAPDAVWAPKALLAAAALEDGEEADGHVARAWSHASNPYVLVAAGGGEDPAEFSDAEERLGRSLGTLLADAQVEAQRTDVGVARAVAVIDSVRAAARTDSLTLRCGSMMDSLGVVGVRLDSARVACMRSDSARLAIVLSIDSTLLKDSASLRADSIRARANRRGNRDTVRDTFIR